MTIALITPPALEPLTLNEVKAHLRITHAHEDTVLLDILKAARAYTEFACGQKIINQVWRHYVDCYPRDRTIALQVKPVQSIAAITAYDKEGTAHEIALEEAALTRGGTQDYLVLSKAVVPQQAAHGLEVDVVTGLAETGANVPDILKRAILLLLGHWYEFRGAISPQDQPVSIPPGFKALMRPFKRAHL